MDLSKVTFPTFVLEPRSMLERITDFMSHPDLIFGHVVFPSILSLILIAVQPWNLFRERIQSLEPLRRSGVVPSRAHNVTSSRRSLLCVGGPGCGYPSYERHIPLSTYLKRVC